MIDEDENGEEVISRYQTPPLVIQDSPEAVGMALPYPRVKGGEALEDVPDKRSF